MGIEAATATLTVNGRAHALAGNATVADLVAELAPEAKMVAVERNGEIVPRAQWSATALEPNDRIELVRFVQGG